jgi:hypothetical protein
MTQEEYENVTGETYSRAVAVMYRIETAIAERNVAGGFDTVEEALAFGRDHHILIRVYRQNSQSIQCVSHNGRLFSRNAWREAYGRFMCTIDEKGKPHPIESDFSDNVASARVAAEYSDGRPGVLPLYHRDYFVPKGFYDERYQTFNNIEGFTVFAAETGADTSHIYTFLSHLAGPNMPYLLAWLRRKLVKPKEKTGVVPILVSKAQGTGKTTFAEVICAGLFGERNIVVSDQYDSTARFNSDTADALIVCIEEKQMNDARNDAEILKSRVTNKVVRKELKGVDPYYQDSFTDFIITSNNDVPLKFDSGEQRRFMVIEADNMFKKGNPLADEVFAKLRGATTGTPFNKDNDLIAQFKWELLNSKEIEDTDVAAFVRTDAYNKCFTTPRTNDSVEVETVLHAIAPFVRESLDTGDIVTEIPGDSLDNVSSPDFFVIYPRARKIAVNRMLVFTNSRDGQPLPHSVVDRAINDCAGWLRDSYNLKVLGDSKPPQKGFPKVRSRYKYSATVWFTDAVLDKFGMPVKTERAPVSSPPPRIDVDRGAYPLRYDLKFFDRFGAYETVNEIKPGTKNRSSESAAYTDTFLLEADETTGVIKTMETGHRAEDYYRDRLRLQFFAARSMITAGIACRVVYSGGKSVHILVRVKDAPKTKEERDWLFSYLCETLGGALTFDPLVGNVTRLTRAPVLRVREGEHPGLQRVLENRPAALYSLKWRPIYEEWLKRPKSTFERRSKKMPPSKKIFKDAAEDFLAGKYFNNPKWNGKRQETFFALYRIVRVAGYTEEEVWTEIDDQLKDYHKKDEVGYWKSRRNAPIIKEIEADIESGAYEEKKNEGN